MKIRVFDLTKILSVFLLAAACSMTTCAEGTLPPKNIILFIGDGMGVSQISAAKIVKGRLNLEQFDVSGLLTTHSSNSLVTDSAAAGTALATGYKTNNGVISLLPEGTRLKTIVEYAIEKNKATGIVVSSSITHATPATFLAHTGSRKNHSEIAEQIAQSDVDVLFGGGWGYFIPQNIAGSLRSDNKDLLAEIKVSRQVIQTEQEFLNLSSVDSVVGLFAAKHLKEAKFRQLSLAQLTAKAIHILAAKSESKNNKGFFLMIEGSQIDWAGHQNDEAYLLSEMLDFDAAVGVGLDYARESQQTLLIVTSDHETGGFTIHNGSLNNKRISSSSFASTRHTAVMVPVFAYGPGSSLFSGIHDNTSIGQNIIQYINHSH
ncbi:MAG: alkaline phosphatase [gamma proteobacterium symbiont of Taylorina sp.]|nr:alkaline phosphatase [gamma proteobacterium symbiont of Taylorina sp.]